MTVGSVVLEETHFGFGEPSDHDVCRGVHIDRLAQVGAGEPFRVAVAKGTVGNAQRRPAPPVTAGLPSTHYGVSNFSPAMMDVCESTGHLAANQVGYHLFDGRVERAVLPPTLRPTA